MKTPKKKSRFVTLMLISEAGKPKGMMLKRWQVLGVCCILFGLIATFLGIVGHDVYLLNKVQKLNVVAIENKILKEKFNDMGRELTQIQSALDRVNTFATKLRFITALEDPERNQNLAFSQAGETQELVSGQTYSQAGRSHLASAAMSDEEAIFPFYQQESEYILPKLYQLENRIKYVGFNASSEELQVQTLYELVQDQHVLLRSTPSILPARGFISSRFGFRKDPFTGLRRMHSGLDVSTHVGTPVYAPADGMVVYAGKKPDYGRVIVIEHGYGITSRYGHNSRLLVKSRQKVKRGDLISYVGSTGRTSGPHLHYEVRINEIPVDPENFILDEFGPLTSVENKRTTGSL